jgi:hypothetical protein
MGGEEGVQAGGRVIGYLFETNPAGAGAAVLNLDGANDEDLGLEIGGHVRSKGAVVLVRHSLAPLYLCECLEGTGVQDRKSSADWKADLHYRCL